jgi:hypothetical protein
VFLIVLEVSASQILPRKLKKDQAPSAILRGLFEVPDSANAARICKASVNENYVAEVRARGR